MEDPDVDQRPLQIRPPFVLSPQHHHRKKSPLNGVSRCPPRLRLGLRILQPRIPVDRPDELALPPLCQHHVERERDGCSILRYFRVRSGLQPVAEHVQAR